MSNERQILAETIIKNLCKYNDTINFEPFLSHLESEDDHSNNESEKGGNENAAERR